MLRKLVWVVIGLVCLVPIILIGHLVFKAPSKEVHQAQVDFVSINEQHLKNEMINVASIEGDSEDAKYVRIHAEYLNKTLDITNRLTEAKNKLYQLAQPANFSGQQTIYTLLEQQNTYDKEINTAHAELNAEDDDVIKKISALDRTKVKNLDPVEFADTIKKVRASDDKEIDQYSLLSQYVKTMLEFINMRKGLYQVGSDGIHFTNPADQDYYNQVITGLNQCLKLIDNTTNQHNMEYRKYVTDLSGAKSGYK